MNKKIWIVPRRYRSSIQVVISTAPTDFNRGGTTSHERPIEVQATRRSTSYPAGGIEHTLIVLGRQAAGTAQCSRAYTIACGLVAARPWSVPLEDRDVEV
jgi:hypothetical protein